MKIKDNHHQFSSSPSSSSRSSYSGGAASWTWPSLRTKLLVSRSPIGTWVTFFDNFSKKICSIIQASGTTLGFARGNVGFLALGDLGKEFNTGLPVNKAILDNVVLLSIVFYHCNHLHPPQDGEYCDIIRDCSQKIQISGGRGYFQSPDQDPVVAICVGCWDPESSTWPHSNPWFGQTVHNLPKNFHSFSAQLYPCWCDCFN